MSGISSTISDDLIQLSPDLTFPSRLFPSEANERVTFNPSTGGLVEALGLSGKYAIYGLTFAGLPTTESATIKLTVDSTVIWNSTFSPTVDTLALHLGTPFICRNSLSLEVECATDPAVTLVYTVKKIL